MYAVCVQLTIYAHMHPYPVQLWDWLVMLLPKYVELDDTVHTCII